MDRSHQRPHPARSSLRTNFVDTFLCPMRVRGPFGAPSPLSPDFVSRLIVIVVYVRARARYKGLLVALVIPYSGLIVSNARMGLSIVLLGPG